MAKSNANPMTAMLHDEHASSNTPLFNSGVTPFNGGERERKVDTDMVLKRFLNFLSKQRQDNLKPKLINSSIKNKKINYNKLNYINRKDDDENKYINKTTKKLFNYLETKK